MKRDLLSGLNVRSFVNSVDNGRLIEIFRGEDALNERGGIQQVVKHILTPERIGGNHYHLQKYEIMYVNSGEPVTVFLRGPAETDTAVFKKVIKPGYKFDLVPGIAHALYASRGKTEIWEFTNLKFDESNPTKDIYELDLCTLP